MAFDEVAGQRQPDAEPAFPSAAVVRLHEHAEDQGKLLRRDAHPAVTDGDLGFFRAPCQ
jgi:hypothetical protein